MLIENIKQFKNKILYLITKKDKKDISNLFILGFIVGLFELIGLALIVLMIQVFVDTSIIESNKILNYIYIHISNSNIMIFIVKERTKEIGIRKALGAPPVSIERLITFESILITSISGFLGLIAGSVILDSMEETLKEYWITDPGVSTSLVIGATITLIIAGTIAAYLPAKRASEIKPIVALRDE
mgnify:CR=1 FL=1